MEDFAKVDAPKGDEKEGDEKGSDRDSGGDAPNGEFAQVD